MPAPTVVSRKDHPGGGPFDIDLPMSGAPGVEGRSGGPNEDYQIVFLFPGNVTFANASVTAGIGSVASTSGNGTNTVTVNLTGVSNIQVITISLSGVDDGTRIVDVAVKMGVLIGDVNGDGSVNSGDAELVRKASGQSATMTSFQADIDASGAINSGDAQIARSNSGEALP
jgi:hypothetical protein